MVEFGHLDAYLAVHGVWAMACLAEIYEALGDAPAALSRDVCDALHALADGYPEVSAEEKARSVHRRFDSFLPDPMRTHSAMRSIT